MFRMTALFVVERNKAHLLSELFKLLKLSAQASRHLSRRFSTASQASPKGGQGGSGENAYSMGFNPLLMRKRGSSTELSQMPSGGMSDDDGNMNDASLMSGSAMPAAQQESGLR